MARKVKKKNSLLKDFLGHLIFGFITISVALTSASLVLLAVEGVRILTGSTPVAIGAGAVILIAGMAAAFTALERS